MTLSLHQHILPQSVLHDLLGFVQHHLLPPAGSFHVLIHVPFHVPFHDPCPQVELHLHHLLLPDHDLFYVTFHDLCSVLHHLYHLLLSDHNFFHVSFRVPFLLYHYLALHFHHCFQHSFGILRFHVYQDYAHFRFPFQTLHHHQAAVPPHTLILAHNPTRCVWISAKHRIAQIAQFFRLTHELIAQLNPTCSCSRYCIKSVN